MAYSGYGLGQTLALLEEALTLSPRLVIVGLYGGNDLIDTFFMVRDEGKLLLTSSDPTIGEAIARAQPQVKPHGALEGDPVSLAVGRAGALHGGSAHGSARARGSGWVER